MPRGARTRSSRGRTNLRDTVIFPSFDDCPDENDVDLPYYDLESPRFGGLPALHWCFFGEIVDFSFFGRLVLEVQDAKGRMTRIACYDDDDQGMRFLAGEKKCKKGYTAAVLYPQSHFFMDGSTGFRVEEASLITILPCGLQELLAANDKLLSSRPKKCSASTCKETENLLGCSKCHITRYCGKDHQIEHWKMHKAECKAICALEWFAGKNWTRFNDWFSFA